MGVKKQKTHIDVTSISLLVTILVIFAVNFQGLNATPISNGINKVSPNFNKTIFLITTTINKNSQYHENDVASLLVVIKAKTADSTDAIKLFSINEDSTQLKKKTIIKNKQVVTMVGSVNSSNKDSLYIIDGVFSDSINSVDPADIQSISTVKDASELAMYGSKAANGVIVIVTKSGSKRVSTVKQKAFPKATGNLPLVNRGEFATVVNNLSETSFFGLNIEFSNTAVESSTILDENLYAYAVTDILSYNLPIDIVNVK